MGIGDVSACIYHFDHSSTPCSWYEGRVPLETEGEIVSGRDFVVLPECHLQAFGAQLVAQRIPYAIFVQSAYLVGAGQTRELVRAAFAEASLVFSISDDSTRYLRWMFPDLGEKLIPLRWSVPTDRFRPADQRSRLITFMPRRMADHSMRVIELLSMRLPSTWRIQAIERLTERQVAEVFRQSQIFMAFSGMEGLPLPPVEAALAGNRVVGYHGQGAREYWDPALFREIEPGNLMGFAEAVLEEVEEIERGWATGIEPHRDSRSIARQLLAQRYSPEREQYLLASALKRVQNLIANPMGEIR
jgi:hypothetical protein